MLVSPAPLTTQNRASLAKADRAPQVFATLAALNAAIAAAPGWVDGTPIYVSAEAPAYRLWSAGAGSALTAVLRPGLNLVLASASNSVLMATGAPGAGVGSDGDRAVDWAAGVYYTKAAGAWAQTGVVQRGSSALQVSASRPLTDADDGAVLECTAAVILTVPTGLRAGFACAVIPLGATSVASSGGALLNGATTTLGRPASANAMFAIQARASAANSYVVTGA